MSNYTTQVRFICETANRETESKGYNSLDEILEAGREYIFDFSYPIFDAEYKPVLETKILKHYYTREIGEETVGLWKLRLNARLNEIMPFYNKLYESELLAFNPLYDVDYTRSGNREGNENREETTEHSTTGIDSQGGTVTDTGARSESTTGTGTVNENSLDYSNGVKRDGGTESRMLTSNTGEATTDSRNTTHDGSDVETTTKDDINDRWDYYSDTPQGTIGFIPGSTGEPQAQGALENQTYLTNVRHIHDDTTGSEDERTTEYGHTIGEVGNGTRESNSTGSDILTLNTSESTENTGINEKSSRTSKEETRQGSDLSTREYNTRNTRNETSAGLTSGNARNLEEYTERVQGKMGTVSYSRLLQEFRETFLNIDMMIIDSLSDLFFGLWE